VALLSEHVRFRQLISWHFRVPKKYFLIVIVSRLLVAHLLSRLYVASGLRLVCGEGSLHGLGKRHLRHPTELSYVVDRSCPRFAKTNDVAGSVR
jgi:hypothetical protein